MNGFASVTIFFSTLLTTCFACLEAFSNIIVNPLPATMGNDDHSVANDGEYVWRFGYGSNIGRKTLENKKNLTLKKRFRVGAIPGWVLYTYRAGHRLSRAWIRWDTFRSRRRCLCRKERWRASSSWFGVFDTKGRGKGIG